MSAGWVAASVRGRSLMHRRLGTEGARTVAAASYAEALALVCRSPYGRDVRPGMDVQSATTAVWHSALWHLRILAGWGPPLGAGAVRTLAGGFELANIDGLLLAMAGGTPPASFVLGSLARVRLSADARTSPAALRRALAGSPWGDPGSDDPDTMRLALRVTWAARVLDEAPGAQDWAVSGAALLWARVLSTGAAAMFPVRARRDLGRLLGRRAAEATTLAELQRFGPRAGRQVLAPALPGGDLWRAEAAWWRALGESARALTRRPVAGPSVSVGVAGSLAADAWQVAAALQLAAASRPPTAPCTAGAGRGSTVELVDALG